MAQLSSLRQELESRGEINAELLKILHLFYDKMAVDTMIGFFFQGKDLEHIIEQQRSLLTMVMGVSPKYGGKPVSLAHVELPPILPGQFQRRLVLLRQTLQEAGLSEASIKEWVGFEKQFEKVIVK